MLKRPGILAIAVTACAALATSAHAGRAMSFSSDTGAGSVVSFDWDGGDEGDLFGAMNYAANRNGNFGGVDFRRNQVNIFLIDFASDDSGRYDGAGLTLFVMWGNQNDADGPFAADVDVSPPVTEDDDDGSYNGVSHIFALGDGVTIDDDGPVTVDIDVENDETPVGFAITNVDQYPGDTGRVNMQFTLAEAIRKIRMLGFGQGKVWQAVDDDGNDEIFTDGLVLVIPAPPAAIWGLAGLAGIAFTGRRRTKRFV